MEKILTINDKSIFYRDKGSGDAILILHGWGSKSDSWIKTQDDLVRGGYRVVVPDLPGFGQSEEPSKPWFLKDYSEFIDTFREALDIEYFTLVGHSFGGRISIDYTIRNPKRLRALVLCDAAGVTRHNNLKTKIFLIFTKIGNAIFTVPILSTLRPYVQRIWYKLSGERDYYQASELMRKTMQIVLEEKIKQYLPNIKKKTLILWGEKDMATPVSDAIIIHKSIPLTHLHIFVGLGHAIHLEAPHGVAKQIDKFLKNQ